MPNIKLIIQKGFTLIEILLVIGFIAIASIGTFITYKKLTEDQATLEETQNILRIITESKSLTKSQTNVNIDTNLLAQYRIINNKDIYNSKYKSKLPFLIDFSSLKNSYNRTTHLRLTYNNINGEYCGKLLSKYANNSDFISVDIEVLKNNIDKDNPVSFSLEKMFASCERASLSKINFNITLLFPLN